MGEKAELVTTESRGVITPMSLLQKAQDQGASIEQMQQLLDLQERWERGEARKAYNEAMSSFREECPTIDRTRKGHNTMYAGLAETIEAIKPLLAKHGLSHRWKTQQDNGLVTVECTVTHRQGHSESTTLSAEPDKTGSKNNIQAIGSTVAYLERYTLYAILGLASREMDDDAQGGPITQAQAADLDALIDEVKADRKKFLAYCQIESVEQLPASKFKDAVAMLEAKRRK